MKIAWCADCHVGNHRRFGGEMRGSINDRCQLVLDVFDRAVSYALDARADVFVVAGDLIDQSRPEAPVLRALQRSLKRAKDGGCKPYLMLGNHEQNSTAAGDHALAPLAPYAVIVEKPKLVAFAGVELLLVPFQPGHAKDWLPDTVRALVAPPTDAGAAPSPPRDSPHRVLGLHLGIRDAKTAPWLSAAPDAIDVNILERLCVDEGIAHVFAGNWHDRRSWSFFHVTDPAFPAVEILQLGALAPTGWDNPSAWDDGELGGYGTVALIEGHTVTVKSLPGPRFVKCSSVKEAKVATARARVLKHRLFVSINAAPEELEEQGSWVAACTERGEIAAGEVLPDATMAKHEAKNAAAAARGSDTIAEAVSNFVEHMPLPDHVNRARVMARSQEYLK